LGVAVLDASSITEELSVGAAPPPGYYGSRFDVVVLVSEEYQPPDSAFPGVRVHRVPFDASIRPTSADFRMAIEAAKSVASDIVRGRRVLVTCSMGRNRSALVAALAIHRATGVSGRRAADYVRRRRVDSLGVRALSNPAFVKFLSAF